jgi:hypothetical protein
LVSTSILDHGAVREKTTDVVSAHPEADKGP